MTVTPFWVSYAVVLIGLYIWAARLIEEPTQRDDDTSDREENGAA